MHIKFDFPLLIFFRSFVLLGFLFFSFSGCRGHRAFSSAQLQNDDSLYSKEINKRIELHKQNGDVINGFLTEVRDDSVAISSEEVDPKPRRIAKADIKYFYVYDESGVRSGGALVTVYAVLCAWFAILLSRK